MLENNPSQRCGAKTRQGGLCRNPPVKGKKRCRMHGGAYGSGAPKSNINALKHGFYSHKGKEARQNIEDVMKTLDFLNSKLN